MNPEYKNIGNPIMHLLEECGELVKAVCKAERFGWGNSHPDNFPCHALPKESWCDKNGLGGFMGHTCGKPRTNFDDVAGEMGDINAAWREILHRRQKGEYK